MNRSSPQPPQSPPPSDSDAPDATSPTSLPLAMSIALVAVGGAGGALCRYELELLFPSGVRGFPWATAGVNVSGAAVLGLLLTLATGPRIGQIWAVLGRPLLATGFIGAYTTWSTFMVETVDLTRAGAAPVALGYLAASLVGGLTAAAGGVALAHRLTRRSQ